MMGTLRFMLALMVLLSHAGWRFQGLNPGVMAVVVFYLISGYVMAGLMGRHYSQLGAGRSGNAWRFYLDRAMRLYPQYLLYAAAVALWLNTVGHPTMFLQPPAQPVDWWRNVLIVPLNFFMYNGSDRFTLVPPAWSLGTEILFYLILPWLWQRWWLVLGLGVASLGVQALSWHGLLHSDWWGYRLLPGVFWLFALGLALSRWQVSHPRRALVCALALPVAALLVLQYLAQIGQLMQPYHRELLLGLALGMPLVHAVTRRAPQPGVWATADAWLGNLSYGIFLNHFLFIWLLGLEAPQGLSAWLMLVGSSIAASAASYVWIERPVLRWRRALRQ